MSEIAVLKHRGLDIDIAIEHCEACAMTGLCRAHEGDLAALADAAEEAAQQ